MSPNPTSIIPIFFNLFFRLIKYIKQPIITIGKAAMSRLKETIWAVSVVPMFAPIMMPMACLSVIKPALTKPTVNTEQALLLCIITVATTPINTEDHDLLARKFMIDFNLLEVSL
jgi:hypothetical protein